MNFKVFILEDEKRWHPIIKNSIKSELKKHPSFTYNEENDCYVATKLDNELKEKLEKELVHLAIIDYSLDRDKEKNGDLAIKILHDCDFFRKTKAIMYTSVGIKISDVEKFLSYGAFSYVKKSDKLPTLDEMKIKQVKALKQEISRALDQIERDEYMEMIGKLMDRKVPDFFKQEGFVQKLEEGCWVRKVIFLSDLANSTSFLNWVQQQQGAHVTLGEILADLLGWQADTINTHEGVVDKFYGDEIRAYFGTDISDPSEKDAQGLCNDAVKAALSIALGFPDKLDNWLQKVTTDKGRLPPKIPYPRILIHYEKVLWAMYGSETHRDFTIWTENVALLNRMLSKIRDRDENEYPCNNGKLDNTKNAIGEIYITGGVKSNLPPGNFKACPQGNFILRDIGERTLFSIKIDGALRCKECKLD